MTADAAAAVVAWAYEPPYDVYNVVPKRRAQAMAELLDSAGAYYTITDDEAGELIGFCCFGASARVRGGDYTAPALDVGIGLRPDLTGQGLGPTIIAAILDAANALFNARTFRVTIAAFNKRSLRAFTAVGFKRSGEFTNRSAEGDRSWVIMTRPVQESRPDVLKWKKGTRE